MIEAVFERKCITKDNCYTLLEILNCFIICKETFLTSKKINLRANASKTYAMNEKSIMFH